jgi:5-methylcytosine-specific restriction endonuclease McrA
MKRPPINKVYKKKAAEKRIEEELRQKLLAEHGGKCMQCQEMPDWRGLSLHHKTFKSHGGASELCNVMLCCGKCHSRFHGITEK